ncbi:hypothetical protein EJ03DRAFT_217833 [Teratosphaeria nubilosa]|uniref:Transcription factor IIA, alpha/beta subunit n=1 Tax=Teratosphaeria nubilosa TaxID=161662 RepID=A0A6G1KYG3_9PEZI|nr:hypothetical protein EJ03DRAFT_217833 [Teratosphaeria nubilosa]
MTNALVGDVYAKIISDVVREAGGDFDDHAISRSTLQDLQQEWQAKLSRRNVAQMPWDPKPAPPPPQQPTQSMPSQITNSLPPSGYYEGQNGGSHIKQEPDMPGNPYNGMQNGYAQQHNPMAGGEERARQLIQERQQQNRGGLTLPGQNPQQRQQGIHLPGQGQAQTQQQAQQQAQHQAQYRQHLAQQQQQAAMQQGQPRIKIENDSPQLSQGGFQQQQQQHQRPLPKYSQTDGNDDGLDEWQSMLAQRRAAHAQYGQRADRMMRDQAQQSSADLESGLMVPLNQQPNRNLPLAARTFPIKQEHTKNEIKQEQINDFKQEDSKSEIDQKHIKTEPTIPQLDGDFDEDEDKPEIKDEDDENVINSDLDDSDDEGAGAIGEDDDDMGDSILCTYDKVQRVKNKWKCTLKDGVMSVGGKEYVFHKGMGEFEW